MEVIIIEKINVNTTFMLLKQEFLLTFYHS